MGSSQNTRDFYAILGIEEPDKADEDEIKKRYKQMSLLTHPDKNRDDPTATARFQLVHEARETLLDPQKRRLYDIERKSTRFRPQSTDDNAQSSTGSAYDEYTRWFGMFTKGSRRGPRAFGFGDARMPGETRRQRAEDLERARKEWRDKAQQNSEDLGKMRENMREKQEEINETRARKREEAQRRQKESEKKAWENQRQRFREKIETNPSKGSSSRWNSSRIFHNLSGSSCEHRGQWDMMREPLTCQCCCRFMPDFVYRCQDCSMVACKRCMRTVKKGCSQ